jgi:hypothetical protein
MAVLEYLGRQNRTIQPNGYQDDKGHWIVLPEDRLPCCQGIQESLLYNVHMRGLKHVAMMFKINPNTLRKAIKVHKNARK